METATNYNIVVFACNEQKGIADCLDSLLSTAPAGLRRLIVIVNGSSDNTLAIANRYADSEPVISVVVLTKGDKANAWNHYVEHEYSQVDFHLFADGDIVALPGAIETLLSEATTKVNTLAVGATPANGRTKTQWVNNMQRWGRLAGALYLLSDEIIKEIRECRILLPQGIIGEDLLLTCLVKGAVAVENLFVPNHRLTITTQAQFSFTPLKWWVPSHWRAILRRLYRYQLREHQLRLLYIYMRERDPEFMPADIKEIYQPLRGCINYRYQGRYTPLDAFIVWKLKRNNNKTQ